MQNFVRVRHDALHRLAMRILVGMQSSEEEARIVADHLVEANLKGHDSHGVGMLPSYFQNHRNGTLRPNQHIAFLRQEPSMAVIDGQMGYGQVVAREATAWAIGAAQATGIGLFTLRDTQHVGRVGSYGEQACAAGMVSLHFVNVVAGDPRVAPFGGSDGRMSTEPVCISVPTGDPDAPVILDMATSAVALGKMRIAYNEGRPVKGDILIDSTGQPTDRASVLYEEPKGAVLPFGLHKGSGLALICGLLGGALGGGGTLQPETPRDRGIVNGMFSIVIDPGRLIDLAWFAHEVTALIDWVKASPAARPDAPVQVAGEPERAARARRMAAGIDIDRASWQEIGAVTAAVGLSQDDVAAVVG